MLRCNETRLNTFLSKSVSAVCVPSAESSASGDRLALEFDLGPIVLEQNMKPLFARSEIFIDFIDFI